MHKSIPDALAAAAAMLAAWWAQFLSPLLQAAILILTVLFLALGVALRWRQLRAASGPPHDPA
ncbi:MAG: hypothetical protein M0006_16070 [Magnetospirillum sp.]|nr:hypothetical protein [Magnetospirillum sp.]